MAPLPTRDLNKLEAFSARPAGRLFIQQICRPTKCQHNQQTGPALREPASARETHRRQMNPPPAPPAHPYKGPRKRTGSLPDQNCSMSPKAFKNSPAQPSPAPSGQFLTEPVDSTCPKVDRSAQRKGSGQNDWPRPLPTHKSLPWLTANTRKGHTEERALPTSWHEC